MNTRVMLVEDHRMVREALRDVLSKVPDIEVVAEAGDGREALEHVRTTRLDVVVLDITLPDFNGIEVTTRMRDQGCQAKVIALSAFSDKRFVKAMLRAGASGYVTKSAAGTELVQAIRSVAAGQGYFSPDIAGTLATEMRDAPGKGASLALTRREREVLRLIAEGLRSQAIAAHLKVSVATVDVHRRNLMRKLALRSVADLTKYAIREGIVTL
jgi:two-component system NarL family response regulator